MEKLKILTSIILTFFFVGCSQSDLSFDNLKNIEIGQYQLQVPMNFIIIEEQGYDSMVGRIEGSGISMSYDYGMYTSPEQNVSEENFTIINEDNDGIQIQILVAKNPQRDNTAIHISFSENSGTNNPFPLKIWSTNLKDKQQDLVLKIFNSITVDR
ncbi:hypothetical protein [Aquiflexum sp.]|uniref:hypothetical protein n=1 Tax=Aquiflexum sp. TaxID=1872584 RepID=UPI0035930059